MQRLGQVFITTVVILLVIPPIAYAGITWTPIKRLTNNASGSYYPDVCVYDSNIYVVWMDDAPGNSEIYFKRSNNGGASWVGNKRLTDNSGRSYYPAIAVDGSNIYVVWQDDTPGNYEIFFKRSNNGGVSWTKDKQLTNNAGASIWPAIAVDGSNIYVAWQDDTPGNYEIFFKQSTNEGVNWTTNRRLTNNAGGSYVPALAVHGPNIYVTWHDTTPGNSEIYFKRSLDGGANWTVNKRLTFNAGNSYASALAVDGSKIYTVWFDDTPGNYEIYFKKSFDGGANWRADKRLTNNTGASRYPALAVDGPNIYVVWFDVTPMNLEIYFKQSLNAGVNWTANKRLTNNTGRSEYPALAVDGSNIHVIWQDETPGNLEIYYKKGVLD